MVRKIFLYFITEVILVIFVFGLFPHTSSAQSICPGINPNLTDHMYSQFIDRIKSTTPDRGLNIYSYRGNSSYDSIPSAENLWQRNSDSWTQNGVPLDFTGVSGWNDDSSHGHWSPYTGVATMITKRHFITANHFKLYPGTTVVFFDKGGRPVLRKVIDETLVNMYGKYPSPDINIGLLDEEVDSSIAVYPVIDTELLLSMIRGDTPKKLIIPMTIFNQQAQALIRVTEGVDVNVATLVPSSGDLVGWGRELIGGDSGQPGFIIINNQPIVTLVNLFAIGTGSSAANNGSFINEINDAIRLLNGRNNVSHAYSVTLYNTNCFTTYPPFVPSIVADKSSGYVGDKILITATDFMDTANPIFIFRNIDTGNTLRIDGGRSTTDLIAGTGYEKELKLGKVTFEIPNVSPGRYSIELNDRSLHGKASLAFTVLDRSASSASGATPTPTPAPNTQTNGQATPTPTPRNNEPGLHNNDSVPDSTPTPTPTPTPANNNITPTPTPPPRGNTTTPTPTPTPTPRSNTTITTPTPTPIDDTVVPTPEPDDRVLPFVSTLNNIRLSNSSYDLIGRIDSVGNDIILSRGFLYGGSTYNRIVSESGSFDVGRYELSIINLACNSSYRFKSFARNSIGTVYGDEKYFTTPPCQLVSTPPPSESTGDFIPVQRPTPSSGQVPDAQQNNRSVPTYGIISKKVEFKRNLKLGDIGEDVRMLQIFLNNLGYTVAEFGDGSFGHESDVFDENTRQALIRYQSGLIDSGIQPTGILDNATQVFVSSDLSYLESNDSIETVEEFEVKDQSEGDNIISKITDFIWNNILARIWSGIKNTFGF